MMGGPKSPNVYNLLKADLDELDGWGDPKNARKPKGHGLSM
jgi:hypothetical protein